MLLLSIKIGERFHSQNDELAAAAAACVERSCPLFVVSYAYTDSRVKPHELLLSVLPFILCVSLYPQTRIKKYKQETQKDEGGIIYERRLFCLSFFLSVSLSLSLSLRCPPALCPFCIPEQGISYKGKKGEQKEKSRLTSSCCLSVSLPVSFYLFLSVSLCLLAVSSLLPLRDIREKGVAPIRGTGERRPSFYFLCSLLFFSQESLSAFLHLFGCTGN